MSNKSYRLNVSDDSGSDNIFEFDEKPEVSEIENEIDDWVSEGSWPNEGCTVSCSWVLFEIDGDEEIEIENGSHESEVEPDHGSLIESVIPSGAEFCGADPVDHEWTSEGEGGIEENPGVWSLGGTKINIKSHCKNCGLHRSETLTGSQKNPGESDSVEYSWIGECVEN